MNTLCAPLAAALLLGATVASAQATMIKAGVLLDPATGATTANQTIVVENGRITAVGPNVKPPPGARYVDLTAFTVMPGLIDAHVHLAIGGTPRDNALANLNAGFTTVVDLGARTHRLLRIRDSINAGQIPGPRVLAAGIWVGTKNGVCEFGGIGIDGGPDAFRERVRGNVDAGADVIKICVSGWPAAAFAQPLALEIAQASLEASVDEAGARKRIVLAHAISLGAVEASIRSGVNGLAHAAYVSEFLAREMRGRGTFMIPTLASLVGDDTSDASRALIAATRTAYRTGVTLVFGTDGGVLPHGRNAEEFLALTKAGVRPEDAIRSATINAARAFQLADSIGSIAPGMVADIIAVRGTIKSDLSVLGNVSFVMSRGRVVKGP
jgi:imidazolonepropionase-like amidohydrolase